MTGSSGWHRRGTLAPVTGIDGGPPVGPARSRWLLIVAAVALVCCGATLAVPVVWFVRETIRAGAGQPSPDAAAEVYLSALSTGDEAGLLPVLDDRHSAELLAQWRAYRADMQTTDPPPAKLEYTYTDVRRISADRALVVALVHAVWSPSGAGSTYFNGGSYEWRITTRDDGGWRVTSVVPYRWCGGHVRADACR